MISHFHKCIFIHIPKNAGQSIETVFLNEIGLSWKQRAPLLLRRKVSGELGPKRLSHLTAEEYLQFKHIPADMYDSYFKFCIIRNPWDRAYSLYKYLTKQKKSFSDFVIHDFSTRIFKQKHWFARPQVDFIHSQSGENLNIKVYRFENLSDAFLDISQHLSLETTELPHSNKSSGSSSVSYRDVYCSQSKDIIYNLYEEDVRAFDYNF